MNKTIITVEDAAFMNVMMKQLFKSAGYEVVAQANNGKDGVEFFQTYRPEIVVLDIVMPGMDGIEVLKEIINIESQAKVVMCTALGFLDKVLSCLLSGAASYVVKPFQAETLLSAVERVSIEEPVFCTKTIESYFEHEKVKKLIDRKIMLSQESIQKLLEDCKKDDIGNIDYLFGVPTSMSYLDKKVY